MTIRWSAAVIDFMIYTEFTATRFFFGPGCAKGTYNREQVV